MNYITLYNMAKQKNSSQLENLKKILENKYIDSSNILVEKNKTSKGVEFKMERKIISHNDIKYLIFRYDPDKVDIFPYFNQISGLKKICDYFMFVEEGQNFYAILIELKLGIDSAKKQLEASDEFIKFLIKSSERVGLPNLTNFNIIKVRLSEERSKKRNRTTKQKKLQMDENRIINYDHSDVFRIMEVLDVI